MPLNKDVLNFEQISVPDSYGRLRKAYEIDRDGFTLLAMGFTGDKALKFKLDYIKAFNEMEDFIKSKTAPAPTKALTPAEMFMQSATAMYELEKKQERILREQNVLSSRVEKLEGDREKSIESIERLPEPEVKAPEANWGYSIIRGCPYGSEQGNNEQ